MKILVKYTVAILFIATLFISCLSTDELTPADENNITGVYYDLTVESDVNQGTVTTTPYRIKYAYDDKIILTAKPIDGYEFVQWIGSLQGTNAVLSFNIKSNYKLKAVYKPKVADASTAKPYLNITAVYNESTKEWDFKAQLTKNGIAIKDAKIGVGINTLSFDSFFEEYIGNYGRAIDNSDYKLTFSQPEIGDFSYTIPISFFSLTTLNSSQSVDKKSLTLAWQSVSADQYRVYRTLTSPTSTYSEIYAPGNNVKNASFTVDIASVWLPSVSSSVAFNDLDLWVAPVNIFKTLGDKFDSNSRIEITGKPTSKVHLSR